MKRGTVILSEWEDRCIFIYFTFSIAKEQALLIILRP